MDGLLLPKALAALLVVVLIAGCVSQQPPASPPAGKAPVKATAPTTSTTGSTVSTTSSTSTTTTSLPKFLVYQNMGEGFSIKYLSRWHKVDNYMGTVVLFLSLKERPGDPFQEHVNVIVDDLSANPMTQGEYTELSLNQIKQLITDVEVKTSRQELLGGRTAQRVVYTGRQGQGEYKWMQVWTVADERAYVITYTAVEDEYDVFIDDVEEMIESFKII